MNKQNKLSSLGAFVARIRAGGCFGGYFSCRSGGLILGVILLSLSCVGVSFSSNYDTIPPCTDLGTGVSLGLAPEFHRHFIYGFNSAITNVEEDLWSIGGSYTWPSDSGINVAFSSSSAADVTNGTGARTLKVQYLDTNWDTQTETVYLNGQSAVQLSKRAVRINRLKVLTVGTGKQNAGVIYCASTNAVLSSGVPSTNSEIYRAVSATYGKDHDGFYTVPKGYTGYVKDHGGQMYAAYSETGRISVWQKIYGESWLNIHPSYVGVGGQTGIKHYIPTVFEEKTDIIIKGLGGDDTARGFAGYIELMLKEN